MAAKTRQWPMLIIDVAAHMQIAVYLNRAVVLQLDEAAGLVDKPKFADWCWWRCLRV